MLVFHENNNLMLLSIGPYGHADSFDHSMGLLTPYSHVPHVFTTFSDNMSFTERWYNTIIGLYDWMIRYFVHNPLQDKLAKKYFAHLEPLPSIDDLLKSRSIIFVNLHRAISIPRPSMNIVYIGGAHIKNPKPLPNDIKQFLDESEHGVIYFSFGTVIKSSLMPKNMISGFLSKFLLAFKKFTVI